MKITKCILVYSMMRNIMCSSRGKAFSRNETFKRSRNACYCCDANVEFAKLSTFQLDKFQQQMITSLTSKFLHTLHERFHDITHHGKVTINIKKSKAFLIQICKSPLWPWGFVPASSSHSLKWKEMEFSPPGNKIGLYHVKQKGSYVSLLVTTSFHQEPYIRCSDSRHYKCMFGHKAEVLCIWKDAHPFSDLVHRREQHS